MCMGRTILPGSVNRSTANGYKGGRSDPVERPPECGADVWEWPQPRPVSSPRCSRPDPAAATPDPGDCARPRGEGLHAAQQAEARAAISAGEIPGAGRDRPQRQHRAPDQHPQGRAARAPTRTSPSRASTPSPATTTASASSTSATRRRPKTVAQVLCPGSQNDISVSGNLLFLSTDSSRSDNSCTSTTQPATEKSSWEGMKIFDISDKTQPEVRRRRRDRLRLAHPHAGAGRARTSTSTSPRTRRTRPSPTASRRTTASRSSRCRARRPQKAAVVDFPVLFPERRRRQPGRAHQPGRLQDHRLPRHHRAALEGPGRRRLHG